MRGTGGGLRGFCHGLGRQCPVIKPVDRRLPMRLKEPHTVSGGSCVRAMQLGNVGYHNMRPVDLDELALGEVAQYA